ncbi:MAG: flavodoxin domain-containing protein [Rhodobacteraceae bacterium]|nr:flavodoxin domain-containing protein [Paracoccaceae bacterium]
MKRILVLYGTLHGQAAKVAARIGERCRAVGHQADVIRDRDLPGSANPDDYDVILVVASFNNGRYPKALTKWIAAHAKPLSAMPSAFFAISGAACDPTTGERDAASQSGPFLTKVGWTPRRIEHVAGAFPFTKYSWFEKWVMKTILKRGGHPHDTKVDYEYTDWPKLDRAVTGFLDTLT